LASLKNRFYRHAVISQKLSSQGSVSVSELSRELQISEVTIRKDLADMEDRGLLRRVSGGAVQVWEGDTEDTLFQHVPRVKNLRLKHAVAKEASALIEDGDSVIITSGATPHLTALYAGERTNLKIVTDSFYVAADLCRRKDYQTIVLGGELHKENYFVHGRDAVRQASRYMADKAILTMDGVDPEAGLTTLRVEGADALKSILARARFRIIVADITKIGAESFCHIGPITIADVLVTNETVDPEKLRLLKQIEEAGVIVKFARM